MSKSALYIGDLAKTLVDLQDMDNALYTALSCSHPRDRTGYYTLLRAFQHHVRGESVSAINALTHAMEEHSRTV